MPGARIKIRPSNRLVRATAMAAVAAIAALVVPWLMILAVAYLAIVASLAAIDWVTSRREPAVKVERMIPERMVTGRPVEVIYRVARPGGGSTAVEVLDELPTDLGGDLTIDEFSLERAGGWKSAAR